MSKSIAFFDFDGTLTTRDTLLEFIKFSKGKIKFYLGFMLNSPFIIAYKFKVITNQQAKEKVLSWFFKNMTVAEFDQLCDTFGKEIIPTLLRPGGVAEIIKLQQDGVRIVIVSASPFNWIRFWAASQNIELVATQMEVKEHKLTGKIQGVNCHGQEKVRRIKEAYDISSYTSIYCYGDTKGDLPMLELATVSNYKPFR